MQQIVINIGNSILRGMKDGSVLYDWTKKWFFEEELPAQLGSLDSIVSNSANTARENHNQVSFRIVYDGDRVLNEFAEKMINDYDNYPRHSVKIENFEDFRNNYIQTLKDMPNDDVTSMYNHISGEMLMTSGELQNSYQRPDGSKATAYPYVQQLPDDFLHPKGLKTKYSVGTGTKAVLLTTGEHKELGGVILKTSQYHLGPKVVLVKDGKVAKESFAKYENGAIDIRERAYKDDGTRTEYSIGRINLNRVSSKECLPSYDLYDTGASPYCMSIV